MSFINEFSDCLGDTAIWREFVSRGRVGGVPTYKTGIEFDARLVQKSKLVRDQNGDQVISSSNVILGNSIDTNLDDPPDVRADDEIELSNGDIPVILTVERPQDETGVAAYTKVFFK